MRIETQETDVQQSGIDGAITAEWAGQLAQVQMALQLCQKSLYTDSPSEVTNVVAAATQAVNSNPMEHMRQRC